jgi:hypothetical protein
MKNKILIIGILAFAFAFVFAAGVYAVNQNGEANAANQTQNNNQIQAQNQNEQVQGDNETENQVNGQNREQEQEQEQEQNQNQNQKGQVNAQQHRSAVANFVQGLLQVADREGGIGDQVRTIAQQQNQSSEDTVQALDKVQSRGRVMTFFLGPDYKNLGELRSQMVQTQNRLSQLTNLLENVQNVDDKAELQNQIQTLEQEQQKLNDFVSSQEGKFSLFGWLVKLFNK